MKKQNWLFFPFILAMGICLFGCNFGNNTGNVWNPQNTLAVVVSSDAVSGGTLFGTPMLSTPYGYFAAPSLNSDYIGSCLLLSQFTIDFDNQPSTEYYTATNISGTTIDQQPFVQQGDTADLNGYTLPMTDASAIINTPSNAYYQGKCFLGIACKDKNPSFDMIYNDDEQVAAGKPNLYLRAKASSGSSDSQSIIYAFDMSSLVQNYGRDTTIAVSGADGVKLKYIVANLKYLSGMVDDEPVYTSVQDPLYVYSFQ